MPRPPPALRAFLLCVDLGFLAYWAISALHLLPPEWLYAHHEDPVMDAWNWSFLPLDLTVSATGLGSLWLSRRGDPRWPLLAAVSLAFTSASGLNALAFWALTGDYTFSWWAPNLLLFAGPWPLLSGLWRQMAGATPPGRR
jgi:hypothetical protein